MTAAAIANLIATLLPTLIGAYKDLAATDSSIPPLETLLAQADSNWQAVIDAAKAQTTTTTVTTTTK
jgi:hypothetical protein